MGQPSHTIIPRHEVGFVPPTSTTAMLSPDGWVLHWVGVPGMNPEPTLEQTLELARNIQADAMRRGYVDFEYNFAVDPMGRILEARGFAIQSGANGNSTSNRHAWAVVYLGGPGMEWTPEARAALHWLVYQGALRSGAISYVKPHRAVLGVLTDCPGDEGVEVAADLNAHLHDDPDAAAPTAPDNGEDMIIRAPERFQKDPYRPVFAHLDKDAKLVWFEGGVHCAQPAIVGKNGQAVTGIPSITPIIGWDKSDDGERIIITAEPFDSSGAPAFTLEWPRKSK